MGLDLCAFAILGNRAHADSSESPRKAGDLAFWEELAFWETIKNSNDSAEFEAYLSAFPGGRFARLAEIRIRTLERQAESDSAEETDGSAPDGSDVSEGTATGSEADAYDGSAPTTSGIAETSTGSRFQDCDVCPQMIAVPAGDYLMGSDRHRPDEKPRHAGTFTQPFAIGMHEVTNRSYKGAPTDGSAWLQGNCIARVLRGGSWNLGSDYMRTTRRHHYDQDVRYYLHGLRVVRSLP